MSVSGADPSRADAAADVAPQPDVAAQPDGPTTLPTDVGPVDPRCPQRPCLPAPIIRASSLGTWLIHPDGRTLFWGARRTPGLAIEEPARRFMAPTPGPRLPDGLIDAAAGTSHVCGLFAYPRRVICWGDNADGQLGRGSFGGSDEPTMVANLANIDAVAATDDQSWALTETGTFAWGRFQLYGGVPQRTSAPMRMHAAPAYSFRFATGWGKGWGFLTSDGEVFAFGFGAAAGSRVDAPVYSPTRIGPMPAAVDYAATFESSCAVAVDGAVYCWGARRFFLTTANDGFSRTTTPERVADISDAVRVHLNGDMACALTRGGLVQCWGRVDRNTGSANAEARVYAAAGPVMNLPPVRELTLGLSHACAITTDDVVYCWGDNDQGQLGPLAFAGNSSTPVLVGRLR